MDNQHHWPLSGHWYRSPRLHCLAGKGISRHIQEFTEFTTFHVAKNLRHWPFSLKEMRSPEASWNSTASAWPKMTSQKPKKCRHIERCKRRKCPKQSWPVPDVSQWFLEPDLVVTKLFTVSRHKYSKLSRGTCLLLCATCLSLGDSCNKQDAGTPQDNAISK